MKWHNVHGTAMEGVKYRRMALGGRVTNNKWHWNATADIGRMTLTYDGFGEGRGEVWDASPSHR